MNPIEYLLDKQDKDETWEGLFECSRAGCHEATKLATYDPDIKTLFFKCPAGHTNVVENM